MDATKFEDRKEELLNECELAPQVFQRVMTRLERFMKPFVDCLVRREQVEHAGMFVRGLLSDLRHKNAESIAYRFGQERMPLQWFIGMSPWDDEPLRDELARQVGKQLGQTDGVIVFDPSAFPKSGKESVGVARQGHEEVLVVIRYKDRDDHRVVKMDYYLSNASLETELLEFGRAAKAEHRIEECIQRAKSEAGLADYEVRTWRGWHHHQALSLIATWFLVTETRRGKKIHAGAYGFPTPRSDLANPAQAIRMRYTLAPGRRMQEAIKAKRTCLPVPLETA